MKRFSSGPKRDFDPRIEGILLTIRRSHIISEKISILTKQKANPNNKTLKELDALDISYHPLYIEYPKVDGPFELKSRLIYLLPTVHSLAGEYPFKHLKKFHVV